MNDRVFTTVDVAKLCKVSLRTVIRWVDEGKLPSFRTPGGHRRVKEEDLRQFMGRYKIPFSVGSSKEAKKILILEERNALEEMLHRILRRSSDLFEITRAADLYECAMHLGLVRPHLVILEMGSKVQELDRFFKAMAQIPETRETRVLVLGTGAPVGKKGKSPASERLTVLHEPFTLETVRPHLLAILGDAPASVS